MSIPVDSIRQAVIRVFETWDDLPGTRGVLSLLEALGYRSGRVPALTTNTPRDFLAYYDRENRLNKTRALVHHWLTVDILLQLTRAEIREAIRRTAPPVANRDMVASGYVSCLFITIQLLPGEHPARHFRFIAHEVNRGFPNPVITLFRHGDCLTLAAVERRPDQRTPSDDVLGSVTLVREICPSALHPDDVDLLARLGVNALSEEFRFEDPSGLNDTWIRTLDTHSRHEKYYGKRDFDYDTGEAASGHGYDEQSRCPDCGRPLHPDANGVPGCIFCHNSICPNCENTFYSADDSDQELCPECLKKVPLTERLLREPPED